MRCAEHDLAAGPDGRCVVCRREGINAVAASGSDASGRSAAPALIAALTATLALTAVGVGVRLGTRAELSALDLKSSRQLTIPDIEAPPSAVPGSGLWGGDARPTASPPDPNAWRAAVPRVRVIVYTTTWCPACKAAKRWLGSHGYAYDERDIEASAVNRIECKALNPHVSIPTFDIDGDVMVGFSDDELLSKLERAARKKAALL